MKKNNQGAIISGLILIGMGIFFLGAQFFPNIFAFIDFATLWPLIPLGVGIVFFLGGMFGSSGLLVPGTVVSGVGAILFYQNSTHSWYQWQLWLLVPLFAGIGIILSMLRAGKPANRAFKAGATPLAVGAILYFIFSGFHTEWIWPLLFIGVGLAILFRSHLSGNSPTKPSQDETADDFQ